MTCIVGLVDEGAIYMGGDSASVDEYYTSRITALTKVFKLKDFVIGYTTSFRMGQILQYHLEEKLPGFDNSSDSSPLEYMVARFVPALREALKENGWMGKDEERESGGEFLIGYKGELFCVDSDFQVNTTKDNFDAIGSGATFALGAIRALSDTPPFDRVVEALTISEYFCATVRSPFHLEVIWKPS